jgi:hypothetical protein
VSLLEPVRLSFCDVLLTERWDAPAGRWFAAYRARHGFRWMLGHVVVDEFATISSPLFFASRPLLGKIYDAGISLAHRRDREMAIDLGWPPLCVGLDTPVPELPADWQETLLDTLRDGARRASDIPVRMTTAEGYELALVRYEGARGAGASVLATSAPLLPAQLGRLCDLDGNGLTLAFATGNRIARQRGRAQDISVVSEARFAKIAAAAAELLG